MKPAIETTPTIVYRKMWVMVYHPTHGDKHIRFEVAVRAPVTGKWSTRVAVPFRPVFAWFRFIWGSPESAALERLEKYITAYSEAYTQAYPGVGATISYVSFAEREPKTHTTRVIATSDNAFRTLGEYPEGQEQIFDFDRRSDKWTVIG